MEQPKLTPEDMRTRRLAGKEAEMLKKFFLVAGAFMPDAGDAAYDAKELLNTYGDIVSALADKGLLFKPETPPEGMCNLTLTVTDDEGGGIMAQVKLFPMDEGNTPEMFLPSGRKIDFIRLYTQPDGTAELALPLTRSGRYLLVASKGPAYAAVQQVVSVTAGEEAICRVSLSQIADWRKDGWYSGDLHHHSVYSSPMHGGTDSVPDTPREVACSMRAVGLSFGALSDHHNIKNHREWLETAAEDFVPLISKEISTSNGHVMALNVPTDVIYRIPGADERTETYLRNEFIRITDEIKAVGGLAQLNHPTDRSPAISLNPKFKDMLEIFDTMEIWNGSNPMINGTPNHDAFLLWLSLLEEGRFIPATSGSDTHFIQVNEFGGTLEKITWVAEQAADMLAHFPAKKRARVSGLLHIINKTAALLEDWIENRLGTGGVQTFIHIENECTPDTILAALRKGNSFLTVGPLLKVSLSGKGLGETLVTENERVQADITLLSNQPLERLKLYMNGERTAVIPLEYTRGGKNGFYDYSLQIPDIAAKDTRWIVVTAERGHECMAICNPVFIARAK